MQHNPQFQKGEKRVDRPYTICHMMTSLDGKIMGKWMDTPAAGEATGKFYDLILGPGRYYEIDAVLCGRITTEDNYTNYRTPDLPETAEAQSEDYVAPGARDAYLYVNVDSAGKSAWEESTFEMHGQKFHVVEALSDKADVRYKAHLKAHGISYITAGADAMDLPLLMRKLRNKFGVKMLMIGGGGILNWSCIEDALCDELSIVMTPAADGSARTQSLFMAREPFAVDQPVEFNLLEGRPLGSSIMWLRYQVLNSMS